MKQYIPIDTIKAETSIPLLQQREWNSTFAPVAIRDAWVKNGDCDDAPDVLQTFFKGSNTHSSIINFIANTVSAGCFEFIDSEGNAVELNETLQTVFNEWKTEAAESLLVYGGAGAIVKEAYDENGIKYFELTAKDGTEVRIDTNSMYEMIGNGYILFSDTFSDKTKNNVLTVSEYYGLSINDKMKKKKVLKLPNFKDYDVIHSDIFSGYFATLKLKDIYSLPLYFSYVLLDCLIADIETAKGVANQAINGFSGGGIFHYYTNPLDTSGLDVPEHRKADAEAYYGEVQAQHIERVHKDVSAKLKGKQNTGNIILSIQHPTQNLNGEAEYPKQFHFEAFEKEFDTNEFLTHMDYVTQQIFSAHNLNPILLQTIDSNGIDNGKEKQMTMAFDTLKMSIKSVLERLCDLPNLILSKLEIDAKCTLNLSEVNYDSLSEAMLYQLLTDDLMRERYGLPVLDDAQKEEIKQKLNTVTF